MLDRVTNAIKMFDEGDRSQLPFILALAGYPRATREPADRNEVRADLVLRGVGWVDFEEHGTTSSMTKVLKLVPRDMLTPVLLTTVNMQLADVNRYRLKGVLLAWDPLFDTLEVLAPAYYNGELDRSGLNSYARFIGLADTEQRLRRKANIKMREKGDVISTRTTVREQL